jgi:hypothetical protein
VKRILPIVLIVLLLTGCAGLSPSYHMTATPHVEQADAAGDDDVTLVEDYLGLRTAIMDMIRIGRDQGRIRVITYNGNLESDLSEIVYGITRQDPLGAYAVDVLNFTCDRIVSYYEIDIRIDYRRSINQIVSVKKAAGTNQLQQLVERAVAGCANSLVVQVNSYWEQDVAAMVEQYWAENPEIMLELPQTTVNVYPETGASRIMEIDFQWSEEPKVLLEQKKALTESLDGAANYIRYRKTEKEKVQLLYMYMVGRFNYLPGDTAAPLYSAVCEGVAHPWGLSMALQLICQRAGIRCQTVTGQYQGQEHTWNRLRLDDKWYDVDLYHCMTENTGLRLMGEGDMTDYTQQAEP